METQKEKNMENVINGHWGTIGIKVTTSGKAWWFESVIITIFSTYYYDYMSLLLPLVLLLLRLPWAVTLPREILGAISMSLSVQHAIIIYTRSMNRYYSFGVYDN